MTNKYKLGMAVLASMLVLNTKAQMVSSFDSLLQEPFSYFNGAGANVDAFFNSGSAGFSNSYLTAYGGIWTSGWAYSSVQNVTSSGFSNLYASYANGGDNSSNYAVGQEGSIVSIAGADMGKPVKGIYITNGTFAALSMKNGDVFAKKFGGITGNDPDYFLLTIKAYSNGTLSTNGVEFYLADFRNADNTKDTIITNWTWVDLSLLGNTDSLVFRLSSSDNGQFGMNTPSFFCIDNVITDSDTADFENLTLSPNSFWTKAKVTLKNIFTNGQATFNNSYSTSIYGDYWSSGFAISSMIDTIIPGDSNLYSVYAGSGYDGSTSFALAQNNAKIYITPSVSNTTLVKGVYISNTTYTALSMKNGDAFAKKFGGLTGNDSDWFKVTFTGYNHDGSTNTVDAYLADYRSDDNSQDYILKDWKWIDLSEIQYSDSIKITFSSSDVGQFGMNTPAFVALDNFTVDFNTAIDEKNKTIHASVYPNPTNGDITIFTETENATVKVYNITGNLIINEVMTANSKKISLENAATGIYFVHIISNEGTAVKKVVKH
jgi:hypothetical protein